MKHKKYQVIFDTENSICGTEVDEFDTAKSIMLDCYVTWLCDEQSEWKIEEVDGNWIPRPTKEQIESYDMMIDNCTCWIAKLKEDEQTYYDEKMNYYFMSNEDANDINWLHWEELKEKYGW